MANHKSAVKRSRQNPKRAARNAKVRSRVKTAIKAVLGASGAEVDQKLSEAFSAIQKSRGVYHRKAVQRKMSRLAKAAQSKKSA
jgi:small subunit ribosomal protein S20